MKNPDKRIDGVFTFWEEVTLLVAKIAQELKLPGIPPKSAEMIKNKYQFREFCHKNNIPSPKDALLQSEKDIPEITKNLTFPVVIKPIYGACSAFVIRVEDEKGLKTAYGDINKYINSFWLTPEWKNVDLFVEEYVDGQEVDMDILLQDGEIRFWSISDNFQTHEPYFVETGQAIPSRLEFSKKKELIDLAKKTFEKSGITDGCFHYEAKYSSKGAVPIEVNLRMGGDEVYTFVKEAWGVDMVEYAAKIAVGQRFTIEEPKAAKTHLYGSYFLPNKTGKLSSLVVKPELHKKEYLKQFFFFKKVNDQVFTPPQDFDYLGWVTVTGVDTKTAEDNLKDALGYIEYSIK